MKLNIWLLNMNCFNDKKSPHNFIKQYIRTNFPLFPFTVGQKTFHFPFLLEIQVSSYPRTCTTFTVTR